MKLRQIPANQIATGDCVIFPRIGPRIVKTLTSFFDSSVSAKFDDGIRRRLASGKMVTIDESKAERVDIILNVILRRDRVTGKVSMIGAFMDSLFFPDILGGFKVLRTSTATADAVLTAELRNGAKFYSPIAVYWIPGAEASSK